MLTIITDIASAVTILIAMIKKGFKKLFFLIDRTMPNTKHTNITAMSAVINDALSNDNSWNISSNIFSPSLGAKY